jgi:hypothetical protein
MATGNVDRIVQELQSAVLEVEERFPGYREKLVEVATALMISQIEHANLKKNINQLFDKSIEEVGRMLGESGNL